MDQEKIGKLIANLRKLQNLTQAELGDKVGVGFKAVSKWERGVTCPDISIINDLSKILGITADELLAGELKKETKEQLYGMRKPKPNKKLIIVLGVILLTIITTITIIIINNNRVYDYILKSASDEYYVEGNVTFKGNEMTLIISKLSFVDEDITNIKINNYEYEISIDNFAIYAIGNGKEFNMLGDDITISNFMNEFSIYYKGKSKFSRKYTIDKNIFLNIKLIDINGKSLNKNIKMLLIKK